MEKGFLRFLLNFFQRFQAIAREAGADHVDFFHAFLGHGDQRGLGVGLKPLGFAKARLEGQFVLVFGQAQHFSQHAAGLQAFAVIRVAQVQGALGHAVRRQRLTQRPERPAKILVLHELLLGDTLMLAPLLAALRQRPLALLRNE